MDYRVNKQTDKTEKENYRQCHATFGLLNVFRKSNTLWHKLKVLVNNIQIFKYYEGSLGKKHQIVKFKICLTFKWAFLIEVSDKFIMMSFFLIMMSL